MRMNRHADERTRQRTRMPEVDDGYFPRLRIDEEVVWIDLAVIHHQWLVRKVDLQMRGPTRTASKGLR